jgi:PAS domain S-box-containing protein
VSQAEGAAEKVNILLVDDRPENLLVLKSILAPLDQNIVEVQSGKAALKCLLDEEFAVILLDVMMPEMDGFETARLIRTRPKSAIIPIIFVTAMFTEETHALSGYEVGAVDYIMKPFVPEILRSKVKNFIEMHRKTREIERQAEVIRQIEQREYENRLLEARQRMEYETQRVRTEQQITQAIVEHSPMGILRLTTNMSIAEANPTFCEQFKLDLAANQGRHVLNVLPWLPEELIAAMQKGLPYRVDDFEIPRKFKPQVRRWWEFTTWPVKDDNDNVTGALFVSTDVTERKILEEQRQEFIGTLAHDLQTPVIASDRALELLIDRLKDRIEPDVIKLAKMLRDNNQNLLRMIQGLLEVYHFEAGAKELYFDKVNLPQLVTICVNEINPLAEKLGRRIKTELGSKDQTVWADRTALRRLITNLLDNAVKYSKEGGVIEAVVSSDPGDSQVLFEVIDYGIGISKEDQKRLFERFWHGSEHKSYKTSSGLGLYLCRQIVEAHGGTIVCESKLGKMTKFTVSLPKDASKDLALKKIGRENLPVSSKQRVEF